MSKCRLCKGHHHSSICDHTAPAHSTTNRQVPMNQSPVSATQPTHTMQDCSTQPTITQNSPTPVQNTLTPTAALNPTAPAFPVPHSSTTLFMGSSKAVLLQTAVTEVYNPNNPASTLKLRLILDSGSQRSYLTERVKHTLGLKRVKSQQLSIATFGASKGDPKHCEVVRVGISKTSG